jgi:phosphogluconate dehydratase
MSGASGKIPAAIHVVPEALDGGPISRILNGDVIRIDTEAGKLKVKLPPEVLNKRRKATPSRLEVHSRGLGRELFAPLRASISRADEGASILGALTVAS